MKLLVSNIQRFSLHDGPGVRTTVFFKGCNLHCPWCANPENISFENDYYIEDGVKKFWAKYYSEEELVDIILKDRVFYGDEGGVTFSGGEPLISLSKCESLLKCLKAAGVDIAVETSLFVSTSALETILPYVDEFYVDVKLLNEDDCKMKLGGELTNYIANVELLMKSGLKSNVIFRIPLVKGVNNSPKDILAFKDFLQRYACFVEIFNVHSLAKKKYERLQKTINVYEQLDNDELMKIKLDFENIGVHCSINKL